MRHGSLFSGIGGFDLASQWMGWENVFQVEIDPFCQKVLEKNFPRVKRYGDIKEFNGTKYRGTVDIISGGFPCQPFSVAGKRKGKADDRFLWPEMLRVIREVNPSFIVGENVTGIIGLALEQVLSEVEAEGYYTETFIIPACAVNAPHRRDRVWIIAYRAGERCGEAGPSICRSTKRDNRDGGEQSSTNTNQLNGDVSGFRTSQIPFKQTPGVWEDIITNTHSDQRCERWMYSSESEKAERHVGSFNSRDDWKAWEDFPTQSPICGRNDGVSNRVDRIKSLGNAIVPQIAYEIFKAIESTFSTNHHYE